MTQDFPTVQKVSKILESSVFIGIRPPIWLFIASLKTWVTSFFETSEAFFVFLCLFLWSDMSIILHNQLRVRYYGFSEMSCWCSPVLLSSVQLWQLLLLFLYPRCFCGRMSGLHWPTFWDDTFSIVVMGSDQWQIDHRFNSSGSTKSSQVHFICKKCIVHRKLWFVCTNMKWNVKSCYLFEWDGSSSH